MRPGALEPDTREQVFGHEESRGISLDIRDNTHPIVYGVKRVILLSSASLDVSNAMGKGFDLRTGGSSETWLPEGPKDAKGMRPFIKGYVNGGRQDAVVLAAFKNGKGKVAIIGTWKILTLPYFADNEKLVENLFRWLRPED